MGGGGGGEAVLFGGGGEIWYHKMVQNRSLVRNNCTWFYHTYINDLKQGEAALWPKSVPNYEVY